MTTVRLLVGTKKGAFILTSDGKRGDWKVTGPHFPGWEIYHIKGSSIEPNRIFASQSTGWFGQFIQRSDDGGETWESVGREISYNGTPGDHLWFDGSSRPWQFTRVWHMEPSLTDVDTVFAGVEDAALFKSVDAGQSWTELDGLRNTKSSAAWQPGAGGMGLHTMVVDPSDPDRMFVAISAAGVFGTTDGGGDWKVLTKGLRSEFMEDPDADVGHCVHRIAMHPGRPERLYMQKHWDVMRSDDSGANWHEVSGNLPTDFGFVIGAHPRNEETVYVIPITSDTEHFPVGGSLKVFRSTVGGDEWQPLTRGLPQVNCYVNVLRGAMSIDSLDPCGIYFGTTGGQVYVSSDEGESWEAVVRDLPAVLSVEVQSF